MMDIFKPFCYKVQTLNFDVQRIYLELNSVFSRYGLDPVAKLATLARPMYALNLSHPPIAEGVDRFTKFIENRARLHKQGVTEADFTEINSDLDGTYTREVIDQILLFHELTYGTKFIGRFQVSYMGSDFGYTMHKDGHTPHRYHLPLSTNEHAYWYFRINEETKFVNMSADGYPWYLNAKDMLHGIYNFGLTPRIHLMLTSNQ